MTFRKIRFILEAYDFKPLIYTGNQLIKIAQTERVCAVDLQAYAMLIVTGVTLVHLPMDYFVQFYFRWCLKWFCAGLQPSLVKQKEVGPVPLPKKRRIYCVLRSPHVNKDSREQLEFRVHRRLIDIDYPLEETIEKFRQLDLLPGVGVKVKIFS